MLLYRLSPFALPTSGGAAPAATAAAAPVGLPRLPAAPAAGKPWGGQQQGYRLDRRLSDWLMEVSGDLRPRDALHCMVWFCRGARSQLRWAKPVEPCGRGGVFGNRWSHTRLKRVWCSVTAAAVQGVWSRVCERAGGRVTVYKGEGVPTDELEG